MKKSILNRPMFRQVKSPAYGTGISANLVSSEERQKYNYGGRVGFEEAGSVGFKKSPFMKQMRSIGEPLWNYGYRPIHNLARYPLNWAGEAFGYSDVVPEAPEIDITAAGEQFYPYIDTSERDAKAPPRKPSDVMTASEQLETSFPRDAEDMAVTTPDQDTRSTEDIIADETIRQRGQLGAKDLTEFREQETETIDTDPFAFLDESTEAKKKLGRGNALMKAAAAAVKWGGAPTAEKRAGAISEGLTGFGDEASKATLAGMDLKDRAKILAATQGMKDEASYERQELKGEQALEKQDRLIDYYDRKLEGVGPDAGLEEAYQSVTKDTGGKDYYSRSIALQEVLQGKGLNVGVQLVDTTNDKSVAKVLDGVIVIDANTGKYFQKKGAQLIPTSRQEIFATLEKSEKS